MEEENEPIDFKPGPSQGAYISFPFNSPRPMLISMDGAVVWCWGWDGAGDLDGPDVDPVWEEVPEKAKSAHAVEVKHDRSFKKH
jgi:alpha-1,3-mannosyltransferase